METNQSYFVDKMILNKLDDRDLINMCQVNKKANKICNDQTFWMNRVFLKYPDVPEDVLRKNKKDRTWSEYYIKDLRKINRRNAQKYLRDGSDIERLDHVIISIKNGGDIHERDDFALRLASQNDHIEVVKYLVGLGANIHAGDGEALRNASYYGQTEVVKYLVDHGANIHADDDSALRNASSNGHLDIVKYLVGLGANIHAKDSYALKIASRYGHLDIVKYLIELKPDGANIHAGDDEALRWASYNGHIEVVKYLVDNGANIHARNDAALKVASSNGHLDIVKYLDSLKSDGGDTYSTPVKLNYNMRNFLKESGLNKVAPNAINLAVGTGISSRSILTILFNIYSNINNMQIYPNPNYLKSTPLMNKYFEDTYDIIRKKEAFDPNIVFRYKDFQYIIRNNVDRYIGYKNYSYKLEYARDEAKNAWKESKNAQKESKKGISFYTVREMDKIYRESKGGPTLREEKSDQKLSDQNKIPFVPGSPSMYDLPPVPRSPIIQRFT